MTQLVVTASYLSDRDELEGPKNPRYGWFYEWLKWPNLLWKRYGNTDDDGHWYKDLFWNWPFHNLIPWKPSSAATTQRKSQLISWCGMRAHPHQCHMTWLSGSCQDVHLSEILFPSLRTCWWYSSSTPILKFYKICTICPSVSIQILIVTYNPLLRTRYVFSAESRSTCPAGIRFVSNPAHLWMTLTMPAVSLYPMS